MFDFLKFVMYAGVVAGLVGFAVPIDDAKLGLALPFSANQILQFGGLILILLGFFGRRLLEPQQ